MRPAIACAISIAVAALLPGCTPHTTGETEVGVRTVKLGILGERGVEDRAYPPGSTFFFVPVINDWHTFDTKLQNMEMTINPGSNAKVMVFHASSVNAYGDLLPISWKVLHYAPRRQGVEIVYALYLLVPGLMIAAAVASALWTRGGPIQGPGGGRGTPPMSSRADSTSFPNTVPFPLGSFP